MKFAQANFNDIIRMSTFPTQLRYADVKLLFKQNSKTYKKAINPSAFFQMYLMLMKGKSTGK